MAKGHDNDRLQHEAWPGFLPAFLIVFLGSTLYLVYIMVSSMGHH